MSFIVATFLPAAMLASASADAPSALAQFDRIGEATASLPTCVQLGYNVDREGLIAWSEDARALAVAEGMTEQEAETLLFDRVRSWYGHYRELHAEVQIMQHSIEATDRNTSNWRKRCDRLTKAPDTAAHFRQN